MKKRKDKRQMATLSYEESDDDLPLFLVLVE